MFESSLEEYYEDYYPTSSISKRVLQTETVRSFSTTVKVRDQELTADGVVVEYDQNITFVGDFGSGEDTNPMQLIVEPLSMESQQNQFTTEYLQSNGGSDFDSVTSVGTVTQGPAEDGPSDSSARSRLSISFLPILLSPWVAMMLS